MSRILPRFLAIGLALFALDRGLAPTVTAPAPLVSPQRRADELASFRALHGRLPDAAERRALERELLDEELLFQEALARGLHRTDPLVRRRLARNLRFLAGSSDAASGGSRDAPRPAADDATLHREALALGMHRSDRVVRRRLVQKLELELHAAVRAEPPDEAELRAHHRATAGRWLDPARIELDQVFLSRTRAARADALLARLRREPLDAGAAAALGDPLPAPRSGSFSEADLARFLGGRFAAAALALPPGGWHGPLVSSQGVHLVRVTRRVEARPLPLESVRARVREDLLARRAAEARRRLLAELRALRPAEDSRDAGEAS